jgi:hypothetical protein
MKDMVFIKSGGGEVSLPLEQVDSVILGPWTIRGFILGHRDITIVSGKDQYQFPYCKQWKEAIKQLKQK